MAWSLQFLGYLRTLNLKFQKDRTKIVVFLALPCWLSQFSLVKRKVFKDPRNCRLHATLILNLVKPLLYIHLFFSFLFLGHQDLRSRFAGAENWSKQWEFVCGLNLPTCGWSKGLSNCVYKTVCQGWSTTQQRWTSFWA